jgi:hypothetical protein
LATRHAGHRARGVEHDEHVGLMKLALDDDQGIDTRLGIRNCKARPAERDRQGRNWQAKRASSA